MHKAPRGGRGFFLRGGKLGNHIFQFGTLRQYFFLECINSCAQFPHPFLAAFNRFKRGEFSVRSFLEGSPQSRHFVFQNKQIAGCQPGSGIIFFFFVRNLAR